MLDKLHGPPTPRQIVVQPPGPPKGEMSRPVVSGEALGNVTLKGPVLRCTDVYSDGYPGPTF